MQHLDNLSHRTSQDNCTDTLTTAPARTYSRRHCEFTVYNAVTTCHHRQTGSLRQSAGRSYITVWSGVCRQGRVNVGGDDGWVCREEYLAFCTWYKSSVVDECLTYLPGVNYTPCSLYMSRNMSMSYNVIVDV